MYAWQYFSMDTLMEVAKEIRGAAAAHRKSDDKINGKATKDPGVARQPCQPLKNFLKFFQVTV
jgi:hypothetical protein